MKFKDQDNPHTLAIEYYGNEHHRLEADITGMDAEEIQDVAEMLTDEILVQVGLLEVARFEEEDE